MIVTKNWVKTPDGKTHGIKEGNILKISVTGVISAYAEIWKEYGLVGKIYHGIPILLVENVSDKVMKLPIKIEGETLSGRKYLLRVLGIDKNNMIIEDHDVFEIFTDE